jgi:hypothetical protein
MNTNNDVILFVNELNIEEIKKLNISVNSSIILKLSVDKKNNLLLKALKYGFNYPVIKNENNNLKLYLYSKYNHYFGEKQDNWKDVLNTVLFTLKNFKNQPLDKCVINIKINKKSIIYLHDYTTKYKFKFDKHSEQREISGVFKLISDRQNNFILSIDDKITNTGKKEETEPHDTIGSFHTHPKDAYIKYNVCNAWPSVDDYCTFLQTYCHGYGFFHVLASIEGIYIISLSELLLEIPIKDIEKNFSKYEKSIRDNYKYKYSECSESNKLKYEDVDAYIKDINEKPYFVVQFYKWKNAHKNITITYNNREGNCFTSDEQISLYSLLI